MKKLILLALTSILCVSCSSAPNKTADEAKVESGATEAAAPAKEEAKPVEAAAPAKEEAKPAEDKAAVPAVDDTTTKLLDPSALNEVAPVEFTVLVKTTKGDMRFKLDRSWAPKGVDRFYNLVKNGYYSDIALFRMAKDFVIQFGIHGKPILNDVWREARIDDDKVVEANVRGTLTFATSGPNSRTTQLFINLGDNSTLGLQGFSPIGKIIEGEDVLDKLNFEYGERPNQMRIQAQGNAYLKENFPNLDYITSMTIE